MQFICHQPLPIALNYPMDLAVRMTKTFEGWITKLLGPKQGDRFSEIMKDLPPVSTWRK